MQLEIQEYLNQLLCDLTVAARNIQLLHWNLKCENFISLHPYIGDIYDKLSDYIDQVAELQRIYNIFPAASLKECVKYSDLEILELNGPIDGEESIKEAIYNISNLKDITNKAVTYADNKKLWDIVQVLSDHVTNYGKIIFFLENSFENEAED